MNKAIEPVVIMENITKRFPGVVANNKITFEVARGEVHGLLGENGAGKTTLMKILSGLYQPDEGTIWLKGERYRFTSPRDALAHGIGMVHQHFMLIPSFTVAENIILGAEPRRFGFLNKMSAIKLTRRLSEEYGLMVNPESLVSDLSVGAQQRVEILKVLSRGAEIIILDEPTAVLTPKEVDDLYNTIVSLKASGHTIIFISHKLNEVLRFTDRVTVLRDGKVIGTRETSHTTVAELANMMVGRGIEFEAQRVPQRKGREVLKVENIYANDSHGLPALRNISLSVYSGEIVGIAGVEGNGQTQLAEVLSGIIRPSMGKIYLDGEDITYLPIAKRFEKGIAYIPEDRQKRGLIIDLSIIENSILGFQDSQPFAKGLSINFKEAENFSQQLLKDFDVRTSDPHSMAGTLSGGNQQKLILAREFARKPKLLIAAQPTRGLDVGATEFIQTKLVEACQNGIGVLLISLDLNEIMQLSHRILVIYEGQIVAEYDSDRFSVAEIGLMMTGGKKLS